VALDDDNNNNFSRVIGIILYHLIKLLIIMNDISFLWIRMREELA